MALRVFISYTHDSAEHEAHLWDLSEQLRNEGVECHIDQEEQFPNDGWPLWCSEQTERADFVLVVCTEIYRSRYQGNGTEGKGYGGNWEGNLIRQSIFDGRSKNDKFIPVVVASADTKYIPKELRGSTRYDLSQSDGYDNLFRLITGQPARKASPVAEKVREMPAADAPWRSKKSTGETCTVFTVPLRENPFFTGREEALDGVKASLEERGIAALTGMGGVGKTQTAAEYAHLHRNEYPAVMWVRAESLETLFADLTQLAGRLELPERDAKEQSLVLEAVKRWLDKQERWLLVLDNVEDFGTIRDLTRKASSEGRHVILTTQMQAMGAIGRQPLVPMEREQGAVLLLRRASRIPGGLKPTRGEEKMAPNGTPEGVPLQSGKVGGPLGSVPLQSGKVGGPLGGVPLQSGGDADLAREISDEVGGLPLALDQAGAYLEETKCALQDYLMLLRERAKELLDRRGGLDSDHYSVAKTFLTSFEKLAKLNAAAAELLQAMAFLPPDEIPEEIFTEGAAQFGAELGAAASDELKWNEAIGAALKYSLVERSPDRQLLAVHRTVQVVLKAGMSAEERKQSAERVVRAVNAAFPPPEFENWSKCERLVPSAQVCAGLVEEHEFSMPEAARLLDQAGYYLDDRARYSEAEPLYRRALTNEEKARDRDRPNLATYLNNLAVLLKSTNRLTEAEPLMGRVIEIFEKTYGQDHPNVAISLSNLAQLLQDTNRLEEAEPLMRRALEIDKKAYGPDHPEVATDLNNLAGLLKATNRLDEAEPLMRRALVIWEKALGSEHPQVAIGLNNLAQLLPDANRLEEAEPLMRRALEIDEKAYGADHPNMAIRLNNLASLLQDTNRLAEAEPLMRRALEIDEKGLGRDHPNVAIRLNNLAQLLMATNRLAEAEPLMRRALAIFQASLGADHPKTIMVRDNLRVLLREMGREEDAENPG